MFYLLTLPWQWGAGTVQECGRGQNQESWPKLAIWRIPSKGIFHAIWHHKDQWNQGSGLRGVEWRGGSVCYYIWTERAPFSGWWVNPSIVLYIIYHYLSLFFLLMCPYFNPCVLPFFLILSLIPLQGGNDQTAV